MAAQVLQPQSVNGGGASGGGGAQQFVPTSLYVGDLEMNVTDSQLYELFNQLGQVVSVRVCRDLSTRRSLGYGYVNYVNPQDAARAIEVLNFTPLNGKSIRIMYSHRDPSVRKSGSGNIFIKNLDRAIDQKALHDTFSAFGNILSCKIATDLTGQSKGYGFVQYDSEEAAQQAIEKLNGMLLNDKQVYVGPFLRKQEREMAVDKTRFTNVFVKNLSESTTDDDLNKAFSEYGTITSAVVMRDADGNSKCFGFVNFENAEDAARAVDGLNGQKFDDKEWYVGKAQKKNEREQELKQRFEQTMKEAVDKSQGLNLYIKNLDDTVSDENLKDFFTPFGTITSCKVMRDPNGTSKGSGFVAFSTSEEASRALLEMNGKMIASKPLYVALAQRKEDRRARLQAQFSQMRPIAMAPAGAPRMPMYPPGGPGLGPQMFYGQAQPTFIPPQPGFGYQQQLVPGMRPGGAPMPNFFMPMVQQGQQGQRPGGRRTAVPGQQNQQQPVPLMQQQMLPRGRVYRYPPGRNVPDVSMGGMGGGGMGSVPYDIGNGMQLRDAGISQPIPIGALASALANASPTEQRTMLGENLYPLVEQLEAEAAAKVTGMLLEMDQTEVLHLLESPEALKAKVAEAMDVLRNVSQQQQGGGGSPADQLAALSLNDTIVS
ncbi:polyadenylate-binding protein 2-like [Cynara cardunculus var. scolymus]|uniref:Polyadenylate-binding protein n=1 Tax=Cynara cardunculus var. scolymus TaxID=59895 RepID=A0A103XMM8_CYNCS|nr:polyadenylate-binding protein 2-like [Cynara cardunculus var. scolymus]XP_024979349.1 polyadenylate-binding protein 2-like [Cynara cardunculus var. scolymus]KVH93299.1 Nucleotide-binding, alpha-beta plait [Cynara cardunculus var. scolymus]